MKKMIKVNDERDQILIAKVYEAGQEHIFTWWEELGSPQRRNLLDQISKIDFPLLNYLTKQHITSPIESNKIKSLSPPPIIKYPAPTAELKEKEISAKQAGKELLLNHKLAVLMSAGENGKGIGFSEPLGMAPIGPVSQKTLYEWQAEKMVALCDLYKYSIPWIIVVSEKTEKATLEYFEKNSYFGLSSADVRFVKQKILPVVDKRGKILLQEKDSICFSTNGPGGVLLALQEKKILEELQSRGIEQIFYFQVENPLVKIGDPVFLGYHVLEGSEISSKVIPKQSVEEEIDVATFIDGKLGILISQDLPEKERNARTVEGELTFYAGNISIHLFALSFLKKILEEGIQLSYRKLEKTSGYINRKGEKVDSEGINALYFETYIFEILQKAEKKILLEVPRHREYAHLRSKEGPFSVEGVKKALSAFYSAWFKEMGEEFLGDSSQCVLEINPNYALTFENLQEKLSGKI